MAPNLAGLEAGGTWDQNHYTTSGGLEPGTNKTSGNPLFVGASDFNPGVGSPLLARQTPLLVVDDLDAATTLRTAPTSAGAFE